MSIAEICINLKQKNMIYQKQIILPEYKRGFSLISDIILKEIDFFPEIGILNLFLKHTSAALSLNENADPDVRNDFESFISRLIPESQVDYIHNSEGADDMPAHIKSSLFGTSINIPITNYRLNIGTWQGIYLCEFRNSGGRREILATIYY